MAISSINIPQLTGSDLASVLLWAQQLKATLETTLAEIQAMERDAAAKIVILRTATKLLITGVDTIPTAVWTAVQWQAAAFDDAAYYSALQPTRLTLPQAGRYRVIALVTFNTAAASTYGIAIAVNGTRIAQNLGNDPAVEIEDLINLNAGDYVEIQVIQNTGGNVTLIDSI